MSESSDTRYVEELAVEAHNAETLASTVDIIRTRPRVGTVTPLTVDEYNIVMLRSSAADADVPDFFLSEEHNATKFAELSSRAESVLAICGVSDVPLTDMFQILGIIKEAYSRTNDTDVQTDIFKIYQLLYFGTFATVDNSKFLWKILANGWSVENWMAVFVKILDDEDTARRESEWLMQKALPIADIVWEYATAEGRPVERFVQERVLYVRNFTVSHTEKNGDRQRVEERGIGGAVNNDPRFMLDLDQSRLSFILRVDPTTKAQNAAEALAYTIVHEEFHYPRHFLQAIRLGKMSVNECIDPPLGSPEDRVIELLTDLLAYDDCIRSGAITSREFEHFAAGYPSERKLGYLLVSLNIITLEQLRLYAYQQDYRNFMNHVDNALLNMSGDERSAVIARMQSIQLINLKEYDEMKNKSLLTCQDLILAIGRQDARIARMISGA